MMIREERGQVALEYILIFAISLILLVVFTIPLTQQSVENTLDVSDSININSQLSKIAQAAEQVYGEGQGSKQTIHITSPNDIKLSVSQNCISCNLKLKSGSSKQIKVNCKSTFEKTNIYLSEGDNTLVVEWPTDSANMHIYTKLF